MSIEIELKAWADDPEGIRSRLSAAGEHLGSYVKDDEYWKDAAGPGGRELGSGVRIRRLSAPGEGARAVATFKRKEVRDGIEVNDEREFEVSDADAFAELLSRLGLAPWIRKRKTGDAWNLDGITAELSELAGLGTFVELEILAEKDDPATVSAARSRLTAALAALGVPAERIETRYYTEMLAAARR